MKNFERPLLKLPSKGLVDNDYGVSDIFIRSQSPILSGGHSAAFAGFKVDQTSTFQRPDMSSPPGIQIHTTGGNNSTKEDVLFAEQQK